MHNEGHQQMPRGWWQGSERGCSRGGDGCIHSMDVTLVS